MTPQRSFALGLVLTAAAVACSPSSPRSTASPEPEPAPRTQERETMRTPASSVAAPANEDRPNRRLTVKEARRYMLSLINRDRATEGLPALKLDEGPPTIAGQLHAEDMARLGYLGHWGSDGSVPEQRHTDNGGADMVLENALCFTDEQKRSLDSIPKIDPAQIERAEALFFNEVPPNDGHRKNILKKTHTRVGIGIAQPVETDKEIAVPCFAQEFVDGWGSYEPLPRKAKVGATVHVAGEIDPRAHPSGVGVARVPLPTPLTPAELNKRRSYPVPKPYAMYWGPGFVSPIPVKIDGQKFSVDLPLSDGKKPGLYEVSVWAKIGDSQEHTMVSLRTIRVE